MKLSIIVAVAENRVIGKDNKLVWHLPDDMKYFKEKTKGHCIITGRKNYESIPEKFRPLSGRTNIVVTRQKNYVAHGATVVNDISKAIATAKEKGEEECFIIGGADIYKQTIELCDKLYYTKVFHSFDGDAFFPEIDEKKWELQNYLKHETDPKHEFSFAFCEFEKIK